MKNDLKLLKNSDELNLDATDYYAVILGESPSKGARSPILWNSAFKGLNISAIMHPMDIDSESLRNVVNALRNDMRFIGGAVTMPYKIDIIPFLDELEPEAEIIGAVNCLYKKENKLVGANTDGEGALWSLLEHMPSGLTGKHVALFGLGGAGVAVATYVANALGKDGRLLLANRTKEKMFSLKNRLQKMCNIDCIEWPIQPKDSKNVDIIINCTSLGFKNFKNDQSGYYSHKYFTPLGPTDINVRVNKSDGNIEKEFIQSAATSIQKNFHHSMMVLSFTADPLVFDIIYQPEQTLLLSLARLMNYRILNGKAMNLEQAVIAFDKATVSCSIRHSNTDEVRNLMSS